MPTASWTLTGSDGHPILGTTHQPPGDPAGVILLCHGFKGYKDYGFFPKLAQTASESGLVAHRFNFSHSGMTNNTDTFERPDLFEKDTWGKQIFDLQKVTEAVRAGTLPGGGRTLPMTWFGHSRGGVTVLLAASKVAPSDRIHRVIAAAAPHSACFLDQGARQQLRSDGFLESPSSRTGQRLRIGQAWLKEYEADPSAFDPLQAIRAIASRILLIHGEADETVACDASQKLANATSGRAQLKRVPGASHTFNAPNPMSQANPTPKATKILIDTVVDFATSNGPHVDNEAE